MDLEEKKVDVGGWREREEAIEVLAEARCLQEEHERDAE